MDCFAALAMTRIYLKYDFTFSRRDAPEWCKKFRPRKSEGAGNAGCALHPRSRAQNCAKKRTRAYRFSGGNPAFPAQWLYGLSRALVSAKSVRMCERAVLVKPPVAGSEPVRARRPKSLPGSVGQVRCLPQPEQLHGLRARTEQGRELDDGTKRYGCRRYRHRQAQGGCVHSITVSARDISERRGGAAQAR